MRGSSPKRTVADGVSGSQDQILRLVTGCDVSKFQADLWHRNRVAARAFLAVSERHVGEVVGGVQVLAVPALGELHFDPDEVVARIGWEIWEMFLR